MMHVQYFFELKHMQYLLSAFIARSPFDDEKEKKEA